MNERRQLGNYTYQGFGFDVPLCNVNEVKIAGEWCLDLDTTQLGRMILFYLLTGKHRLSGNHLRFVRKRMRMTPAQLASKLEVTRQSIMNWEKKADAISEMPRAAELHVRALAYRAKFDNKRFGTFYKLITEGLLPNKDESKRLTTPIVIARISPAYKQESRALQMH